jgi:uncharacterized protein
MQLNDTFQISSLKLAWGKIRHQRLNPKPNGFNTGACFVRIKFSKGPVNRSIDSQLLKFDEPGLFSIYGKNYGFEKHRKPIHLHVNDLHKEVERETGLDLPGAIELQTFPRVLGYVFNPVSFWYFHDASDKCAVILCEVNNTFGERHFYCLKSQTQAPMNKGQESIATKQFHVSPFFPVSGHYRFRFMDQKDRVMARIDYFDNNQLQLSTSISGTLKPATNKLWVHTLLRFGWATVVVITKIHWQAIKLWAKGAKFHSKPKPPTNSMTETKTTL